MMLGKRRKSSEHHQADKRGQNANLLASCSFMDYADILKQLGKPAMLMEIVYIGQKSFCQLLFQKVEYSALVTLRNLLHSTQ